jgi:hypothetical protein
MEVNDGGLYLIFVVILVVVVGLFVLANVGEGSRRRRFCFKTSLSTDALVDLMYVDSHNQQSSTHHHGHHHSHVDVGHHVPATSTPDAAGNIDCDKWRRRMWRE